MGEGKGWRSGCVLMGLGLGLGLGLVGPEEVFDCESRPRKSGIARWREGAGGSPALPSFPFSLRENRKLKTRVIAPSPILRRCSALDRWRGRCRCHNHEVESSLPSPGAARVVEKSVLSTCPSIRPSLMIKVYLLELGHRTGSFHFSIARVGRPNFFSWPASAIIEPS
jgi:hypothetical protein